MLKLVGEMLSLPCVALKPPQQNTTAKQEWAKGLRGTAALSCSSFFASLSLLPLLSFSEISDLMTVDLYKFKNCESNTKCIDKCI